MSRRWQIVAVVFALALTAILVLFRQRIASLGTSGYVGIFVISVLANASIILPVPGWATVFTLGAVMDPFRVGVVAAAGGTIGEMNGYLLGYGGRARFERSPRYQQVERWMRRWGWLTVFVLALVPNPLFDLAGLASGALRYPVCKFIIFGGLGRTIKFLGYSYAGAWGSQFLPEIFK